MDLVEARIQLDEVVASWRSGQASWAAYEQARERLVSEAKLDRLAQDLILALRRGLDRIEADSPTTEAEA